ncbi:MAG: molecular chaperone TorD family protein [Myxococcota bacterium]|jgi:DMSO reductase family type II enzyme chaperone|nr:molecular chaperone TorD family protein [Myxococcota bacterium]
MTDTATPTPITLTELVGEEQISAGVRSQLFALFSEALNYPSESLRERIGNGAIAGALREGLEIVDALPSGADAVDWEALQSPGDEDHLCVEYTRLFDAGASGPPCPLYGGLYTDARMKTMEECVRFYNHFGLTLSQEQRELPDHVLTQLDFLHFLCFQEALALQQEGDPAPFRRAQRDFLARQVETWLPKLVDKLSAQNASPFFAGLIGLLSAFVASESQRLAATP